MEQQLVNIIELKSKKVRDAVIVHDNPRQTVLSYIAGILDGEGTIGINKSKPYLKNKNKNYTYSARISVGMVEKIVPELLKETFGGCLYEERVPNMRSVWRWQVSGRMSVFNILEEITPYLLIKKEQALIAMDFCEDWHTPFSRMKGLSIRELQRREDAYLKMRKLNAVGVAATTNQDSTRECEVIV